MAEQGSYSRTKKSIRNSAVAVSLQVLALLIGFWSRRIFLNHLGTEVLGLNTTANSLLQFLNLAEMGIGGAIGVTLYKPLFENNIKKIREVVALNGWLYKRIALVVIAGSAILGLFFPQIFSKMELPIWYAYASFGVLLYGSLLSYFVNYKQVLLSADQKEYKIQFSFKLVSIFKLIFEAFAVKYFDNGFLWWLGLEFTFSTISAIVLTHTIHKEYPYLKENVDDVSTLHKRYPDVTKKIRQIVFQKIGGFILTQSSPILIYAFASLSLVAMYGNYTILTVNLGLILTAMFSGINGSVGNMVAEGDKKLILKVFREMFSFRFFLAGVASICLLVLTEPFLHLWIGPEYLLGKTTLILVVLIFILGQVRLTVDSFCYAYGIFWDIWAPLTEGAINIGTAILLGSKFGLNGVLAGVALSQIIMIYIWRPYLLFRWGLKEPISYYIRIFAKHCLLFILTGVIILLLVKVVDIEVTRGFGVFFIYAVAVFILTSAVFGGLLYAFEPGIRSLIGRLLNIVRE